MTKRRKAGDIVKKKWGAGFVGEELLIKVLPETPIPLEGGGFWDKNDPCWNHGEIGHDIDCVEWSNCEVVGKWDKAGQFVEVTDGHCVYHVSECELEDYEH